MLGNAYLSRARESDSYEFSVKAEAAGRKSLGLRTRGNLAASKLLVNSLLQQHRFQGALAEADNGLHIAPDDARAHEAKAETLFEVGRYAQARQELLKDDELNQDIEGLSLAARFQEIQGKPDSAVSTMRKALTLAEGNAGYPATTLAWFHSRTGMMLESMGQADTADEEFQSALALYPRDYKAWAGRARIAFRKSDWKEAIRLGEHSNSIAPMADVEGMVGDACAKLGNTKLAALHYAKVAVLAGMPSGVSDGMHEFAAAAIKVGVHGHRLDRQYAMFCADHGRDLDGAYASCLRDLQERQDVYGFDTLAWVCLKRGQLDEATKAEERAMKTGSHDPKLWFHAAAICEAKRDAKGAKSFLAKSMQYGLHPDPIQAPIAQRISLLVTSDSRVATN
jgi:tetratricopeptide (TPR) repeat protein